MEEEPQVLELTGEDLHKVTHAYGTNGIITEIEMPLAPAYDWVDAMVGFDSFDAAASYANALAARTGFSPS
jgi:FAD/FMN-containing dehydrogenase